VTRRKSRQFSYSLHAKINHVKSEDKFVTKPMRMQNILCQKTAKKIFQQTGKRTNIERLSAKVWNNRFNRIFTELQIKLTLQKNSNKTYVSDGSAGRLFDPC